LYWCDTSFVRLGEENKQRVFENRVLRDELISEWRRLHKQELYDLYFSSKFIRIIISRIMNWLDHVARGGGGGGGGAYSVWGGGGKEIDHFKDLGVDGNIILKVDVQEVGREGRDWNDLSQNRDRLQALMNTIMYFWFP
jgi:hypothetical protein